MEWLRLGNLSVGSMTTTILLGVIAGYLLGLKKKGRDAWYLTGYITALFVLLLSYTFRYSIFSRAGILTGQFSNLIVFGTACLVQFAYYYGENCFPREAKITRIIFYTGALVVWGSIFFSDLPVIYDFQAQYVTYVYDIRISAVTLLGYIWSIVVLLRKTIVFSQRHNKNESWIAYLLKPAGRSARSSMSFALLIISMTALALLYLLFSADVVSRRIYAFIFNLASLLICLFIYIVYVNNSPRPTRFHTKLVGIPLATIMVLFGITASGLTPVIGEILSEKFADEVEFVRRELVNNGDSETQQLGASRNVAFVTPVSSDSNDLGYWTEGITLEWRNQARVMKGERGLLREVRGLDPQFFFIDLENGSSFFLYYEFMVDSERYRVGFHYTTLRNLYHKFWTSLALAVLGAALFVVLFFPVLFKKGLLRPLRDLLEAARQVEKGHFDYILPVVSEDDVGQLARGYNQMAYSLKNAEGNFKALAENANDAILLLSKEGNVFYANQRASDISGYNASELRRKSFRDVVHPEDLSDINERFSKRIQGLPVPQCYETRIVSKEGDTVPVELTGARTIWQNEVADVVVIRDITERRNAEELLRSQQQQLMQAEKLASLGALVAGVAHEVNNPNQVISINARLLSEGLPEVFSLAESQDELDENIRIAGLGYQDFRDNAESSIREIEESAERIGHIVGELKSFVREGETETRQLTDINQVVRRVVALSQHFIRKATNRFELKVDESVPKVLGDGMRLEQVVLNLMENACQSLADSDRGVFVTTRFEQAGGFVVVEVRDEGCGISGPHLDRITDPFFTTKRDLGGTGLGLSISSRIVQNHGGELSYISQEGRGTTALVRLPGRPV